MTEERPGWTRNWQQAVGAGIAVVFAFGVIAVFIAFVIWIIGRML